jgi:uncharacterized membrane protein
VLALTERSAAVGYSDTPAGEGHATLWIQGFPTDLTPGTGISSEARAVSESLHVVGSLVQERTASGFLWTPERGLERLGTLPGDYSSNLFGVNRAGTAVGSSEGGADTPRNLAVRCDDEGCVDLNTLVQAPEWQLEGACCINDHGVIGGYGRTQRSERAFLLLPVRHGALQGAND